MKKIFCLIMTAALLLGLTACSRGETRLFAGYCDYYADGGLMSYCEYSYEYDRSGRLTCECEYYNGYIRSTKEREYDGSGSCTESEYDSRDELVAFREFDKDGNLRKETTYDHHGEIEEVTDYNEDRLMIRKESFRWSHYLVEYEYDDEGNLTKETETDYDDYGNGELEKIFESIYDSEGEVIQRTVTSSDGSYVVDNRVVTEEEDNKKTLYIYNQYDELCYITEKEYDHKGNLLNEVTYSFTGGEKEFLSSEEYEYDSKGRVIVEVSKITDIQNYRHEYEYSDEGYLCKESFITYKWISTEVYGDGSDADYTKTVRNEYYNADGETIRSEYFVGGRLSSYTEYYYENVKVEKGRESVFDFRDDDRELDWRSTVVY